MSRVRQIHYRKITRPTRTVFATSLGSKSTITSVLVQASLDDGVSGVGEVPTSFSFPRETPDAIIRVLTEARSLMRGMPIEDYPTALAKLRENHREFHMTLSGLEVALFRASLACGDRSEFAHWGGRLRRLETDITIPFTPGGAGLGPWLDRAASKGFRTFKVKVSGKIEADLAFLRWVSEQLTRKVGEFTIRLDGNQGYTSPTYRRMLDGLTKAKIAVELFEQPLRWDDYAGLKRIRGHGEVPVILDETVFDADACQRVIDDELGDGVNIKIAKSGVAGSAAICKLARSAGLKLMIGCMTETMAGLSAGIYLAAGTGAFDYVDLDGVHFLFARRRWGPITVSGREYILEPGA
ncbi:MAG: enolase C-terminal domain-like protein [Phycisphaerae bacterium]|jgi:L-alanine-DL-glutamate epimerase-like enolase superfamily enzyme|nr:enolase C-terminal domain-like protein [Phycisphaerae bacterium]